MRIVLPNLQAGNFASVIRMAERVGASCEIENDPRRLATADRIILAGVGAFDPAMAALHSGGWVNALADAVMGRGIPVLGICLGMQLLCRGSEEGDRPGLGWLDATVCRFRFPVEAGLRIPHMGWNTVSVQKPSAILPMDNADRRFYFVHSYHVECAEPADVLATTHYGYDFVSAVEHSNAGQSTVLGVQFHPEKSHRFGMEVIRGFVTAPC